MGSVLPEDHPQEDGSWSWADPAPWLLFWSVSGPGQPEAEGDPGCGGSCVPSDLLQSSGLPHSSVSIRGLTSKEEDLESYFFSAQNKLKAPLPWDYKGLILQIWGPP